MDVDRFVCPACGYPGLSDPPWSDGSASHEICPCCGLHFGNDDHLGDRPDLRAAFYHGWRLKWHADGLRWWSRGIEPPLDWDAKAQFQSIAMPADGSRLQPDPFSDPSATGTGASDLEDDRARQARGEPAWGDVLPNTDAVTYYVPTDQGVPPALCRTVAREGAFYVESYRGQGRWEVDSDPFDWLMSLPGKRLNCREVAPAEAALMMREFDNLQVSQAGTTTPESVGIRGFRSRAALRALAYASALGAGAIVVILIGAITGGALGLSAAVGAAPFLVALFVLPCTLAVLLTAALPTRASTRRYRALVGAVAVPAIGFVALLVAAWVTAPPVGSRPTPGPPIDPVPATLALLAFGALVGIIGAWPDDPPRDRANGSRTLTP